MKGRNKAITTATATATSQPDKKKKGGRKTEEEEGREREGREEKKERAGKKKEGKTNASIMGLEPTTFGDILEGQTENQRATIAPNTPQ